MTLTSQDRKEYYGVAIFNLEAVAYVQSSIIEVENL